MALVLNEEQSLLKESVREFLKEKAPISALRYLRDTNDKTGFSRQLWKEMAEMGWTGMTIAEAYGGLAFGYVGLGIILEEMGRTLTASPFNSTVLLGASAISLGGSEEQKEKILPAIVAGDIILTLALEEGHHHNPDKITTEATQIDDGFIINGEKTFVMDGHVADHLIVATRTSGKPGDKEGISLFLVDSSASGVSATRHIMVDSRNSAHISLNNTTVSADRLIGEKDKGSALLEKILDIGRIGLAAEMLGIMQEAFDRTIDYLKNRQQFGVLIGSFQALQHRAADMYAEIELCKSVVLKALQAIDEAPEDLARLASLAKAKTCETVKRVTNEGVQMFGGIGMTDDEEIGFFLKRARVTQQTFGDEHYHIDRFASLNSY